MSKNICKRTFNLALMVVELCQSFDNLSGILRTLGKQLLRSETSIGANVEEARTTQNKAYFISKINIILSIQFSAISALGVRAAMGWSDKNDRRFYDYCTRIVKFFNTANCWWLIAEGFQNRRGRTNFRCNDFHIEKYEKINGSIHLSALIFN